MQISVSRNILKIGLNHTRISQYGSKLLTLL